MDIMEVYVILCNFLFVKSVFFVLFFFLLQVRKINNLVCSNSCTTITEALTELLTVWKRLSDCDL